VRVIDAKDRSSAEVAAILARRRPSLDAAMSVARKVLEDVKAQGDDALRNFAEQFDSARLGKLVLERSDLEAALTRIGPSLRAALEFAASRIETFHRKQLPTGYEIPIGPKGSRAGMMPRALDRIGLYVPGGPQGYPSTALMGCIPARIAGVREIIVATPPARGIGVPPDAVLAAAAIAGADEVLVSGGAQAIAALAYGTASVRPVDKIVGPGNVYVTAAKLLVQEHVATDGIAGPSEVVVVADETLSADLLAAELLAQAEHDPAAVAIAVLVGPRPPAELLEAVDRRASLLPTGQVLLETLRNRGAIVVVASTSHAIDLANRIAPEHLVLAVQDASAFRYAVRNAGCVFLGRSSAAPFGDYVAGTNHVLPTAGSARWRAGLNVLEFVRFIAYVELEPGDVADLAGPGAILARAEGFEAHAAALEARATAAKGVTR